jgi:aerobic-type carbon monoxide dehydrogenase small subunit (CoxS/CutS family)
MIDTLRFKLNGKAVSLAVDPGRSLLWVLRYDLGLTGSKYGCGEGRCGACTVLIAGRAVRSCIMLIGQCIGNEITTIEGLERDGKLHPLQKAFLDVGAMQCGYCTPGMIMGSVALLSKKPTATSDDVVEALEGNICRCGTYARIVEAVMKAAEAMKGGGQ